MATTVRHDIDALNVRLDITISGAEFKAKTANELKRLAQNVRIKGFREGKAPLSMVKSLYGDAILSDNFNKMVEAELNRYLTENPISMFGQPILSENQDKLKLSFENPTDTTVRFDIGTTPQIEVKGLDNSTVIDSYEINVSDEEVNERIDDLGRRMGERQHIESGIEDNDLLTFEIEEIDGFIENRFNVLSQDLTESARAAVQDLKTGDSFVFNPFNFEKNTDEKHVATYFFGLKEGQAVSESAQFRFTLVDIVRTTRIEWGPAFWDKYFGPESGINDDEQARSMFKDMVSQEQQANIDALFFRDAQEILMEKNQVELPDNFLKRWLQQSDEKNTPEVVEREYAAFAGNLRWSVLRDKIAQQADIQQLTYNDLEIAYRQRIQGYMGGMSNMELENMLTDRFMKDEKQVEQFAQELMSDRIFQAIKSTVSLNIKNVTTAEFKEVIKTANERFKAEQAAMSGEALVAEEV